MVPSSFCERPEALGQLGEHVRELAPLEICAQQAGCCVESPGANAALELKSLHWGWGQELGGVCDPLQGSCEWAGRSVLGAIGELCEPCQAKSEELA